MFVGLRFEVEWRSQAQRLSFIDGVIEYAVHAGDLVLLEAVIDIREVIANSKLACGGAKKTKSLLVLISP